MACSEWQPAMPSSATSAFVMRSSVTSRAAASHSRALLDGALLQTNPDRCGYAITGNYRQNCFIAGLLAKASVLMSFVRPTALRPDSKKQIAYLPRGLAPSMSVMPAARQASRGHLKNKNLPHFLVVIPSNPPSFAQLSSAHGSLPTLD
jgi:hypothetical protein